MPKTWERIVQPFLDKVDEPTKRLAEEALEQIRRDPHAPPFPTSAYKGHDLPGGRLALAGGGQVWILYQVYKDMPVIAVRNILDAEGWATENR